MIATRRIRVVFPERHRLVRHIGKIALDLVDQLFAAAVALQERKPQIIADKGIGGPHERIAARLFPVGSEIA